MSIVYKTNLRICIANLIIVLFMMSCHEERDVKVTGSTQKVAFAITKGDDNHALERVEDFGNITKAIVTIAHADGAATEFSNVAIDLFKIEDKLFTEMISLEVGSYHLEAFGLANENNEIKYAVPLQSDPLSANVSYALPIPFEVLSEKKEDIEVEVIEVLEEDPMAFGFEFFEVDLVETIDFLISVSELGDSTFIDAVLSIVSDEQFNYEQELTAPINRVQIREQSNASYTLKVQAEGYDDYITTLSSSELSFYETEGKVLEIELWKSDDNSNNLWEASSYEAGAENVTYVFQYEIVTPSPDLVFYALINSNGFDSSPLGQPSVSATNVVVTIDGEEVAIDTSENKSYNYGSGFFIRLMDPDLATAGAKVVVKATGMINNAQSGTYSWKWIRTANSAGWAVDEFDPEPLVLE